jgi:hypothetical protein
MKEKMKEEIGYISYEMERVLVVEVMAAAVVVVAVVMVVAVVCGGGGGRGGCSSGSRRRRELCFQCMSTSDNFCTKDIILLKHHTLKMNGELKI